MNLTDLRRRQAHGFAFQLGLEGEPLYEAAMAVWSNLNPQTARFDTALSVAGAALSAAAAVSAGPPQQDHLARAGTAAPGSPGPEVLVFAPDGVEHRFTVAGDDSMMVLVDGGPVLGVDQHGPGRWIGEQWQRLYPADRVVDRSISIEGITTEEQWHHLELAVGLNEGDLGRLKPWAGDRPKILSGKLSDGRRYDLDAAVSWANGQGLAYEDEQCVRADRKDPLPEAVSAGTRAELTQGALAGPPERDRASAAGLPTGQAFPGQVGGKLPDGPSGRPAGTMTSLAAQARLRRPQ